MNIFLDFEIFNLLDIRHTSATRYAKHESLEILCMAWAIDDDPVEIWIPSESPDEFPAWVFDTDDTLHAHNAAFERAVWEHHCVPKLGWAPQPLENWSCTAVQCAAMGLPRSLDKAAQAMGLAGKDDTGRLAMLKAVKLNKEGKKERHPDLMKLVYQYCKNDVEVERELFKAVPALWSVEQDNYYCDQRINDRGIPLDMTTVNAGIELLEQYEVQQLKRLREVTGEPEMSAYTIERMKKFLFSEGTEVENLQSATVTAELEKPETTPAAREALTIRQNLGKASNKKLAAMREWESDGRVCGAHLFHSAHTGRWGGRGVQFQNVPQGFTDPDEIETVVNTMRVASASWFETLYGEVTPVISKTLRSMVAASRGHHLVVCDFASIEARVLAWLSNCKRLLKLFNTGGDPYVDMAARLYDLTPEEVTKDQRFLGKVCILGLGYGMGAKTFKTTCDSWGVEGVDKEFAEMAVGVYRETFPEIPSFWKQLQHAAFHVVGSRNMMHLKRVKFMVIGDVETPQDWLQMELPSGRRISYHRPTIGQKKAPWDEDEKIPTLMYWGEDSQTRQYSLQTTYGGKICENLVQGVARDLLMASLRNLEREGHDVIFHVHDEVVVESSSATAEEVERIMCRLPRWAAGCPVGAEGFVAKRYRK